MITDENTQTGAGGDDIRFFSSLELHSLSVKMAEGTRRELNIVSRSLEPLVYDAPDFAEAVKRLVLSGKGRIRIVVLDYASLISRGDSRLVNLAMRLSSFVQMRTPGPDHLGFNEAMLISDRIGFIHRKHSDRFEGIANLHSPRRAALLTESFEDLWEHGETNPYFRRLLL